MEAAIKNEYTPSEHEMSMFKEMEAALPGDVAMGSQRQ